MRTVSLFIGSLVLVISSIAPLSAAPQFSQAECQQLNEQRQQVRKQLRQPYTEQEGKVLQQREKELSRLLNRHCKKPT